MKKLLIVGAGLFGSIVAEQASRDGYTVTVIDARDHIGGNCYTEFDKETGINVHKYGPHIFHTDNKQVWDYICQFTEFNDYRHQHKTMFRGDVYPLPINLDTINKFYKKQFTPTEAAEFLDLKKIPYLNAKNFEQQALSLVGLELYEAFLKPYAIKQWGMDPTELPASIIQRLPVHTNYDTTYYPHNKKYQGIPVDGYTPIFEKMLSHPNITVKLSTRWEDVKDTLDQDTLVIYTGPVDAYFDYCYGQLNWRTLDFEYTVEPVDDYQGCLAMSHPDSDVPWTRVIEHKHFHPERKTVENKTVVSREFSRAATKDDIPYYPVNTEQDKSNYDKYHELTEQEENVIFGGRLGEYKYYDMHQVIGSALSCYRNKIKQRLQ
jgi:UDP-galactopyranose mutase